MSVSRPSKYLTFLVAGADPDVIFRKRGVSHFSAAIHWSPVLLVSNSCVITKKTGDLSHTYGCSPRAYLVFFVSHPLSASFLRVDAKDLTEQTVGNLLSHRLLSACTFKATIIGPCSYPRVCVLTTMSGIQHDVPVQLVGPDVQRGGPEELHGKRATQGNFCNFLPMRCRTGKLVLRYPPPSPLSQKIIYKPS